MTVSENFSSSKDTQSADLVNSQHASKAPRSSGVTMEDSPRPVGSGEARREKTELLYDIYRKEAEDFMAKQQYSKALKSYNLAIKLHPREKRALIGRSRCYLYMNRTFRAMQDAEQSLSIDASDIDAVYQKAEILFLTGNYQLSSVYYKRGQKLDPDSPRFQQGIQRSTQAFQKFGGGMVARNKLSAVGDLSFFLNNKRRSTMTDFEDLETHNAQQSGREELPSAGFRSRNHCPLVRISKKPRFPQLQSFKWEERAVGEAGGLKGLGEDTPHSSLPQPDEDTMRKILGELYGDRQYLQKLQTELPKGRRTRRDVRRLAKEGLDFLRERSTLWGRESVEHPDSAPLPPPPVPLPSHRLSYSRYCRCQAELRL